MGKIALDTFSILDKWEHCISDMEDLIKLLSVYRQYMECMLPQLGASAEESEQWEIFPCVLSSIIQFADDRVEEQATQVDACFTALHENKEKDKEKEKVK